MKISIKFNLEKSEFPNDNRPHILSFAKYCLQNYDEAIYEKFYGQGKTTVKGFTFAVYLPDAKYEKNRIILSKPLAAINFSTGDMRLGIDLYNAFLKQKGKAFTLPCNNMTLAEISVKNHVPVKSGEVIVKFISPLVVRKHLRDGNRDVYLTYADQEFAEVLKETMNFQAEKLIGRGVDFKIEALNGFKTVTCAMGKNINCSLGVYKITAMPWDIEFLEQFGLGSRRSEGYGMFEIIGR